MSNRTLPTTGTSATEATASHSPLPWRAIPETGEIRASDGTYVGEVFAGFKGQREDNRQRILRSVNSHDALVEALAAAREEIRVRNRTAGETVFNPAVTTMVDAALALARGEVTP